MINNPHLKSITDGIALGLLFIGIMGMAINSSLWYALLALDFLAWSIYYMGKEMFAYEPEEGHARTATASD